MNDPNGNPHKRPNSCIPGDREIGKVPAVVMNRNPWDDDEPSWPGTEYDDDEAVADGMCDDDGDPPSPWVSAALGSPQPSLWDEAIARIFAAKSRSDSV